MTQVQTLTDRERELGAIIRAYNEVTERLKGSHERLLGETGRLREELAEKNRELARRQRLAALGEMAAGVAHEIRNPLAGIQLYASLLVRDLHEDARCRDLAERIDAGVRTLDGIVSDVLAFAGQATPQPVDVPLSTLVGACVASVEPARKRYSADVVIDESVAGCVLHVDSGQMQRALLNLMFNALDAASDEGTVWVFVKNGATPGTCAIHVADNGPGVPEDIKDQIFNPFFTTKDSGTGLGLAIAHRIAEAHGGRVEVMDRAGGGAEMVLTLPRAQQ